MMTKIERIIPVLFLCVLCIAPLIFSRPDRSGFEVRRHTTRETSSQIVYTTQSDISTEEVSSNKYDNRWGITELSEEEKDLLAKLVYLEANNTGLEGCQKVVVVIFNRYLNGGFFAGQEPSITSVMSASGQFGPYKRAANDQSVTATQQEYEAIESILTGEAPEEIINAQWLYFNGDGKQNYFR